MSAERPGSVITFYSYKGGVGRTFLLANVAATLRQWGARVLCVDWDLEAPGLHHYLAPSAGQDMGLIDVVEGFVEGKPLRWREAVRPGPKLTRSSDEGRLDLLLAGAAEGYSRRVHAIDWRKLYQNGLGDAIEKMRDEWRRDYDFVLVDSRTGLSDLAGICTIQLPDLLVLVGTASQQSIDGLREVLGMVARGRDALPYERAAVHVLPVLSRFDQRVEHDRAKGWSKKFFDNLKPAFASWLSADVEPERLAPRLRVPHVPYWGFGEKVPVDLEDLHDPDNVSFSIQGVSALLEHHLVDAHRIIDDRDALLAESKRRTAGFETDLLIVAEGGKANPLAIEARNAADPSKERRIVPDAHQQDVLGAAAVLLITERASPAFMRDIADIPSWVLGKNDQRVNIAVLDGEPTSRRGPLGSLRRFGMDALVAEWLPECGLVALPQAVPSQRTLPVPSGDEERFEVWIAAGPTLQRVDTLGILEFYQHGMLVSYQNFPDLEPTILPFKDILSLQWTRGTELDRSDNSIRMFRRHALRLRDPNGVRPALEVKLDINLGYAYGADDVPTDAWVDRRLYIAEVMTKLVERFTGITAIGPDDEPA